MENLHKNQKKKWSKGRKRGNGEGGWMEEGDRERERERERECLMRPQSKTKCCDWQKQWSVGEIMSEACYTLGKTMEEKTNRESERERRRECAHQSGSGTAVCLREQTHTHTHTHTYIHDRNTCPKNTSGINMFRQMLRYVQTYQIMSLQQLCVFGSLLSVMLESWIEHV